MLSLEYIWLGRRYCFHIPRFVGIASDLENSLEQ